MGDTNWAGNVAYGAERIVRPRSLDELRDALSEPGPVHALGSRHSFNRIADVDGTLVDLSALPTEVHDAGAGAVRVSGGARYGDIVEELHRRGLALSNLASLPHISVVGAVATATHGSGDRIGSLATAVRGLTLLTADGEERALRRGDADFAGAVVSLGALGIVTSIELDVEPTYDVAQSVHEGPRWDAVLADLDAVTGAGTSVSVFTRWTDPERADQLWVKQRTDAGPVDDELLRRLGTTPAVQPRHPILGAPAEACTTQLGIAGPWHERLAHFRLEFTPSAGDEIQSEYLVPRADAPAAIEAVRALAPRIAPLLHVCEIRTVAADELWLSSAYGVDVVGIHFTWRREQAAVEALLPDIEAALPETARPHWGKVFALDGAEVRRRYPRWDAFAELRRRLDPAGRFRNAYLEALGL